jgi:hypothetical protein
LDHYVLTADRVRQYLAPLRPFADLAVTPISSIAREWRSVTESSDEYSELIPEFYILPEIFMHVELPAWAHGSPMEFVYTHRKALESPWVSERLHQWIDLIWGYKQHGKDADLAFNLFSPELYEDAPLQRENLSAETGCVPHQLFTAPHPHRV